MIQQEIPIIESVDIQTEIAFNNLCLQDGGGKEQRIILWQDPIRTFNLHKEIVYPVQLTALREFFDLTKGSLESFFYRDKSDWQASRVKQLRSDVQTYGTLYGLGNDEYQICKAYHVGGTIYLRPIACPFNLALFNGETLVTGWTLGDNGKVTFSGAFNGVSFDFYVPVRFETDDLERQITAKSEPDNYVVYSIPKLVLKEVKIDFDDNVVDTFQKNLEHTLSFDLLKGTEIVQYQTDILSQESGFEKRSLVQEIPTTINNLQARNIVYQDDIEYLIALWLCVKGEGASFYFDNGFGTNRVRFVSKALSYTCQSNALVYSLASLQVKNLQEPLYSGTLCIIGGTYYKNLSVPFDGNDEPRETESASFVVGNYQGDVLPISNFVLDDFAFVVKSSFNVSSCYSLVGSTRTINLPSDCFILYDGNNPNYADGSLDHGLTTNYVFNGQTYSISAFPPSLPLSVAIQGVLDMGVLAQPHNNIRLSEFASRGYISGGIIYFKLMHIAHGGGNVNLTIDVPQC